MILMLMALALVSPRHNLKPARLVIILNIRHRERHYRYLVQPFPFNLQLLNALNLKEVELLLPLPGVAVPVKLILIGAADEITADEAD
jgi:hypothetical protein